MGATFESWQFAQSCSNWSDKFLLNKSKKVCYNIITVKDRSPKERNCIL